MGKGKWYIVMLLALTLSCCGQYSGMKAELDEINSLAETDADSAAQLLSEMKESMKGAPSELVMYYDMLGFQMDDKRMVRHTSDSMICRVAEYYERQDKDGHLPQAYYLAGRANSDMRNSEKALFYFFKALQCDSSKITVHLKSRIYAQMGYIYLRNELFEEAKNMQELAYFYCKEEGDTLGMRYSKEDISTISMMQDSLYVDSVKQAEIMLRIQQIKEKVKADKLVKINNDLQDEVVSSKYRTLIIISLLSLSVVGAAVFLIVNRKKKAKKNSEPVQKKFYDREVCELIASRTASDKVLKPADWKLIDERLSSTFPSFKDNLYSLLNLSETEYHICVLIKLEVTPSNMAKLLALSNSSVSQIRLRLQHKVFSGEGSAKDWDNYVLSL